MPDERQCILCLDRWERSGAENILCSLCVQRLLQAPNEEKIRLRDTLLEKERPEAASMVESFIEGERDGWARFSRSNTTNNDWHCIK